MPVWVSGVAHPPRGVLAISMHDPDGSRSDLDTLLHTCWSDSRTQMGFTLLQRLAETGTLYFWTKRGTVANTKFKAELLACVLREAGHITCQNGVSIAVGHWHGWQP